MKKPLDLLLRVRLPYGADAGETFAKTASHPTVRRL